MKKQISKIFGLLVIICVLSQTSKGFLGIPALTAFASSNLQNQIDSDNQEISKLNQEIAQYQKQLKQLGSNKKTLQSAINSLDLQRNSVEAEVNATQHQIDATQLHIQQLSGQIQDTQNNIDSYKQALSSYIEDIHQSDSMPIALQLLSANNLSGFWQNMDANLQVQEAVQQKTTQLQDAEDDLNQTQAAVQQQQNVLSAQSQNLQTQQKTLTATVNSKNKLLAETNSQESTYQKLLSQAEAQLESFSKFTKNAGGDQLLPNQTVCDSWGCYYNQRDMAWGADPLNGTNYSLASDGCLITAVAMVMTHYGYKSVTPISINSNPNNFASYYPAYLLYTVTADGVTATRVSTTIDATLASGNPVIIGMHVYGGTHFVVLLSGSHGNYVMRDPYLANGKDISFLDHYNLGEIYSIAKVVID